VLTGEDLVLRGRNLEIIGCTPRTSTQRGPKGEGGDTRETDTPAAPENVTLAPSTPALDANQSSSASASVYASAPGAAGFGGGGGGWGEPVHMCEYTRNILLIITKCHGLPRSITKGTLFTYVS
jgi:hypothetical protein